MRTRNTARTVGWRTILGLVDRRAGELDGVFERRCLGFPTPLWNAFILERIEGEGVRRLALPETEGSIVSWRIAPFAPEQLAVGGASPLR